MDRSTRHIVRERADFQCEYCHIREGELVDIAFHIEHVIAAKHGGGDEPDNLALACDRCNLHKGSNLSGIDPQTNQLEPLFNPRLHIWQEHFELKQHQIVGKTPMGRTTARVLNFNSPRRVLLRRLLREGH